MELINLLERLHRFEAAQALQAAVADRLVIDLARIMPGAKSGGSYQGICW